METFSICFGIVAAPALILGWLGFCRLAEVSKKAMKIGLIVICFPFAVAAVGMSKFMFIDEPFAEACYDGDLPKVKELLYWGANPNLNDEGNTPLCGATFNGHEEVALYLLDHGAEPGDCRDATLLDLAKAGNMPRLTEALKRKGAK